MLLFNIVLNIWKQRLFRAFNKKIQCNLFLRGKSKKYLLNNNEFDIKKTSLLQNSYTLPSTGKVVKVTNQ